MIDTITPFKVARILKVNADQPELPAWALAERFGVTEATIWNILRKAGRTKHAAAKLLKQKRARRKKR